MPNFVIVYVPFVLVIQIAAGASLRLVVVFVVHITAAGAVVVHMAAGIVRSESEFRGDRGVSTEKEGLHICLRPYTVKKSKKVAKNRQKSQKVAKSAQNKPKWVVEAILERFLDSPA
jgi:cell division protein FtsW (lipid II flippase)